MACTTSRTQQTRRGRLPRLTGRLIKVDGAGSARFRLGCDYQFRWPLDQFVVGVFGDYNFVEHQGRRSPATGPRVGLDSGQEKVDWHWAVGGRIGLARHSPDS